MNLLILSSVLVLAAFSAAEELYTDRYDNINVNEILENDRLFKAYMNCILDKGKCTAEGKELKAHIQDGMQSGCTKCTEKQRQKSRMVVNHIKEHKKDVWEQLKIKYDPENKHKETYEAFLARTD